MPHLQDIAQPIQNIAVFPMPPGETVTVFDGIIWALIIILVIAGIYFLVAQPLK